MFVALKSTIVHFPVGALKHEVLAIARGTQPSNLESPVLETGAFQTRLSRVGGTQATARRIAEDRGGASLLPSHVVREPRAHTPKHADGFPTARPRKRPLTPVATGAGRLAAAQANESTLAGRRQALCRGDGASHRKAGGARRGRPSPTRRRARDDQRENRELKKANEPPRVSPRSSTSPTEVSAFIDERRADFGVELICRTRRRPLRAGGGARQKAAMIRISNEPRDGVRLYAFG